MSMVERMEVDHGLRQTVRAVLDMASSDEGAVALTNAVRAEPVETRHGERVSGHILADRYALRDGSIIETRLEVRRIYPAEGDA